LDEVNAEGASIAAVDDADDSVTLNGYGIDQDASTYAPTAELTESPSANGQVTESPVSEPEAETPVPRAPRRRRRTTASTAVADAPIETPNSES
jgi:hypothetical protein